MYPRLQLLVPCALGQHDTTPAVANVQSSRTVFDAPKRMYGCSYYAWLSMPMYILAVTRRRYGNSRSSWTLRGTNDSTLHQPPLLGRVPRLSHPTRPHPTSHEPTRPYPAPFGSSSLDSLETVSTRIVNPMGFTGRVTVVPILTPCHCPDAQSSGAIPTHEAPQNTVCRRVGFCWVRQTCFKYDIYDSRKSGFLATTCRVHAKAKAVRQSYFSALALEQTRSSQHRIVHCQVAWLSSDPLPGRPRHSSAMRHPPKRVAECW